MLLSAGESLLIILVCALCTVGERALPFLIFGRRPVPAPVRYLGDVLPMAVMATLVVYCLRNLSFQSLDGFLAELIAVALTVALHLWKGNTLLSIAGGTGCYMFLVQAVFA